ncbi:MAG: TRAP transporter large permease subunit [Leucobacter sp.]|nr:TRAP transporter large permease subunit [Leucobacter sp.]
MDPILAVILVIVLLLGLLALEVPVAWTLAISGAVGLVMLGNWENAARVMASRPYQDVAVFGFIVVPMYILLGNFALEGKVATQVFEIAARLSGRRKWALGVATIGACAGFAAVSGSSIATATTIGKLAIPEMVKVGYRPSHAAGIVASGGTLGILIPPSIILVLYGVLVGESIAALLMAGIIPGILSAIAMGLYVMMRIGPKVDSKVFEKSLVTAGGSSSSSGGATGAGSAGSDVVIDAAMTPLRGLPWRGLFRILVIFAIIMVGIYGGWFTVSESAAIAALVALVFLVQELRKQGLKEILRACRRALLGAGATTSMAFTIVVGSATFSFFILMSGVPREFAKWIADAGIEPWLVLLLFLAALIPLGMFLGPLSCMVILMPIAYPIVADFGFSGVWFGILVVKVLELGMITPPVGLNVYVVAGAAKELVTVEDVFKGVMGFFVVDLLLVLLMFAVPSIVLFLPNLLLGT